MPRTCTVCTHPERQDVDRALIGGEPYRSIAQRFAASADAVLRHKREHLPVRLVQAQEAADVAQAGDLLGQVQMLRGRALAILDTAEQAGDLRTALLAIRETRATLELLLEVEGELDRRPTVNLLVTPEWQQVRATLLVALQPFPQARAAVATQLRSLEAV